MKMNPKMKKKLRSRLASDFVALEDNRAAMEKNETPKMEKAEKKGKGKKKC